MICFILIICLLGPFSVSRQGKNQNQLDETGASTWAKWNLGERLVPLFLVPHSSQLTASLLQAPKMASSAHLFGLQWTWLI